MLEYEDGDRVAVGIELLRGDGSQRKYMQTIAEDFGRRSAKVASAKGLRPEMLLTVMMDWMTAHGLSDVKLRMGEVEAEVIAMVPIDTGHYRLSITIDVDGAA